MQQPITVYLQALGAHFLGKNAYNVNDITVKLVYSGGTVNLPYAFPTSTNQNDGNNETSFSVGQSSFMPIISPSYEPKVDTQIHYLNTDADTICATGNFEPPTTIELAHLDISIPTPTSENPFVIKYPVVLDPKRAVYTITVAVPGLYLEPLLLINNTISVLVKMMCGCPITARSQNTSLWHPSDFTVQAHVYDIEGAVTEYKLNYDDKQEPNSLFSTVLSLNQKPVGYVVFSALQKSTGNYGAVTLYVE